MKQDQEFFRLLDAAGQLPTRVNDKAVALIDRLSAVIDALGNTMTGLPRGTDTQREEIRAARGTLDDIRTLTRQLASDNSDLGNRLADLEAWGNGTPDEAPSTSAPAEPTVDQSPDAPGTGFKVMTKEQADAVLEKFDQCIAAGREDWAYYYLDTQEIWALQNRGMKRDEINAKINHVSGGAAPRDLAKSPRAH